MSITDDTMFVRDRLEMKSVNDYLSKFSLVSELKLNLIKCELFPPKIVKLKLILMDINLNKLGW